MGDPTEYKASSTDSMKISQDMKILEQGLGNEPGESGDRAWTSAAPPRKIVKKIDVTEKADMLTQSSNAGEEGVNEETKEEKPQEGLANKKQPMEVDAAPNPDVVLPDYEDECEEEDVWTALRNGKTTFMLVKLPDNEPAEKKSEKKSFLKDLEGQMAKVIVLRSGQIRLIVGKSVFEVRTGTKSSLEHELIAIVHDDETNTDNLVVMGPVQQKITIMPNWETLCRELALK